MPFWICASALRYRSVSSAYSAPPLNAIQNGFCGIDPRTFRIVQLVCGQVAEVFEQNYSAIWYSDFIKTNRGFDRFKLFFFSHGAVLFDAFGALFIPYLHGGDVVTRQRVFQGQVFSIGAFAACCAADDERQHCGVYGAMPPSVNE